MMVSIETAVELERSRARSAVGAVWALVAVAVAVGRGAPLG